MQIIGCFPHEYAWIAERAGCEITASFQAIKACDSMGRIHGMIGYSNWTANSVVMHIALENPACFRELIKVAFSYPFEQVGRNVALATVRANNLRSMRLCKKVGFREAYRVKDGIQIGEDLVIFEMRSENCRWVGKRKAA